MTSDKVVADAYENFLFEEQLPIVRFKNKNLPRNYNIDMFLVISIVFLSLFIGVYLVSLIVFGG